MDTAQDTPALAQQFGQFSRIDIVQGGDVVLLQPGPQTQLGRPVGMEPTVGTDNQPRHVNLMTLHILGETHSIIIGRVRDAVIANEGIGQYQNLSPVTGIRQCFRVSHHARVEDDFTVDRTTIIGRRIIHRKTTKGSTGNLYRFRTVTTTTLLEIQNGRFALFCVCLGGVGIQKERVSECRVWMVGVCVSLLVSTLAHTDRSATNQQQQQPKGMTHVPEHPNNQRSNRYPYCCLGGRW